MQWICVRALWQERLPHYLGFPSRILRLLPVSAFACSRFCFCFCFELPRLSTTWEAKGISSAVCDEQVLDLPMFGLVFCCGRGPHRGVSQLLHIDQSAHVPVYYGSYWRTIVGVRARRSACGTAGTMVLLCSRLLFHRMRPVFLMGTRCGFCLVSFPRRTCRPAGVPRRPFR